ILLPACALLIAADWTGWRGPHRDGVLVAEPKNWPEKLNLKWKVTVGEGHSSPILAAGSIYVFARQDGQETVLSIDPSNGAVGWHDSGALTAFDRETGSVKWSWNGDGPAYASPIAVELGGVRQIVTQTQQNIIGVAANSGKLLWKIPFTTQYVQNIVTPVVYR